MAGGRRVHRRDGRIPRGVVVGAVVVVLVVAVVVGLKLLADRSAAQQIDGRSEELLEILDGSTPRDFLAFNSGRSVPGSVAQAVADQSDFVSVDARADRALIRFQPKGWWAGFTERCIVVTVGGSGVQVDEPKLACVRIDPAEH